MSKHVVQLEVGDKRAGGDVSHGLAQLRESVLPVVLMLLPHDQCVPPEWHALAKVYAGVLTLAVVEAHKVVLSPLFALVEPASHLLPVACRVSLPRTRI